LDISHIGIDDVSGFCLTSDECDHPVTTLEKIDSDFFSTFFSLFPRALIEKCPTKCQVRTCMRGNQGIIITLFYDRSDDFRSFCILDFDISIVLIGVSDTKRDEWITHNRIIFIFYKEINIP